MLLVHDIPAVLWDSLARLCRTQDDAVFLDSSAPAHPDGRFSFLALFPFCAVSGDERRARAVFEDGGAEEFERPVHAVVGDFMARYRLPDESGRGYPAGGAFGFVSYDYAARLHGVEVGVAKGLESGAFFGFYDLLALRDSADGRCFVVSTGLPLPDDETRARRAKERLDFMLALAAEGREEAERGEIPAAGLELESAQYDLGEYAEKFARIQDYISAGDSYQVNFSRLFCAAAPGGGGNGFDVYRALRALNPVPFGGFVRAAGLETLCFSMERFLCIDGRRVQTRPIKGTAPRGRDPDEDARHARELAVCQKNRAELVMIVDLMRNDLGRVCESGSVRVDDLGRVETYAGVHHMVATVSGRLRPGRGVADVLLECMPGGSVTGAPKKRTMQIIDELEDGGRGLYCGCMGYFGFNGISDFNILIRTLVRRGPRFFFRSGGGITVCSRAEDEYAETEHKVKRFCRQSV